MPLLARSHLSSNVTWLCLALLALVLSFGLSWLLLMPLDFAYEWLYNLAGIDQHIAKYGPKNTFKQGFELTEAAERYRLFADIVTAIHHHGVGLDTLTYHNAQGDTLDKLLTPDEVLHLQDVAILIDRMQTLLIVTALLFISLLVWTYRRGQALPTFRSMLLSMLGFLSSAILVLLLIGPHKVFYTLHIWVFPAEHKWFFYYEESLMSTLMKAPDLFAYIAILLLVVAVPIFVLMMWLIRRLLLFKTKTQGDLAS